MDKPLELINKSIGASLLIALGVYVLLKVGAPLGAFLFALGLLAVCYMGQNLFTGKCGFWIQDKQKFTDLMMILLVNLVSGYIFGLIFSVADPEIYANAVAKVATWEFSLAFFIKGILCGVVMYVAVYLYKKGTPWGVLIGIPLFILSGFQHCIANVITMGVARTFHSSLLLAIVGNFLGSLFVWYVSRDRAAKQAVKQ